MMANGFHEVQFPADISYGASGGPEYSTDVVTVGSGYEQRNINWSQARGRWNVAHGVKTKAQMDTLIAFFRARMGKAYGFRFKDWTDYKALGEQLNTGDGTTKIFQLIKTYVNGGFSTTRIIKKPVLGTVKIYVDEALQTSGVAVDITTGRVTFSIAPAQGALITADFEFDVPARFDSDYMPITLQHHQVYSWEAITILEIKV
jgi:uncharacterized protein (TIGR02217 family)